MRRYRTLQQWDAAARRLIRLGGTYHRAVREERARSTGRWYWRKYGYDVRDKLRARLGELDSRILR